MLKKAPPYKLRCKRVLLLLLAMCLSIALPAHAQDELDVDAYTASTPEHQQFLFAFRLMQRGDDRLAIESFEEYLRDYPDGPKQGDAKYYLGSLYRKAGRTTDAWATVESAPAPSLLPSHALPLLRTQLLVDRRRFADAIAQMEQLDHDTLEPTVAGSVAYLRAVSYRALNNIHAARQWFEIAAQDDSPLRAKAQLELARTQLAVDEPEQSLATLKQLLENSPPSDVAPPALKLAGDVAYRLRQYPQAAAYYQRLIERYQSAPQFPEAILGLIWTQYRQDELQTLIRTHERYRTMLPADTRGEAWYVLGLAYQQTDDHAKAIESFTRAAQVGVDDSLLANLLYRQAFSEYETGNEQAMRNTIEQLRSRAPQSSQMVDAAMLLAQVQAREGDITAAVQELTQLIRRGPESRNYHRALLARAQLYRQKDMLQPAMADYQTYLDNSTYARHMQEDGQTVFVPNRTQSGVFLDLIDVLYRLERFEQLQTLVDQWFYIMKLAPTVNQEARYRSALGLLRIGKIHDAQQALRLLNEDEPAHAFRAEADYYLGLIAMSQQNMDEAVALLTRAADSDALSQSLRINAARVVALHHRGADNEQRAIDALARIEATAGREALNDDELIWLAQIWLARDQATHARAYAQIVTNAARNASQQHLQQASLAAAQANLAMERLDEAETLFERVIELGGPLRHEARLGQARIAAARGQRTQAIERYNRLINVEQPYIACAALYEAANLHRELAQQARRQNDASQAAHHAQQAVRFFKRIVLIYPFDSLTPLPQMSFIELAQVQRDLGELDEAKRSLRELIEGFPDTIYALYARAQLAADEAQWSQWEALVDRLAQREIPTELTEKMKQLRAARD